MASDNDIFDEFDDGLELAIESKTTRLSMAETRRKKRLERFFLVGVLLFGAIVISLAFYTEGRVIEVAWQKLQEFDAGGTLGSPNDAINCRNPKNVNTPYCQQRAARTEADWRQITRFGGGKKNAFSLHGKE